MNAPPTEAGYYWFQSEEDGEWRMMRVQVYEDERFFSDLTRGGFALSEKLHTSVFDVGEWIPVQPPQSHLPVIVREYLNHPSVDGHVNRQSLREQMAKIVGFPLASTEKGE